MKDEFSYLMNELPNSKLNETDFQLILNQIDFELPEDYIDFMRNKNGGIVRFKNGVCLDLWKSEKLKDLNDCYHTNEFAPGNYIIGSNGGELPLPLINMTKHLLNLNL